MPDPVAMCLQLPTLMYAGSIQLCERLPITHCPTPRCSCHRAGHLQCCTTMPWSKWSSATAFNNCMCSLQCCARPFITTYNNGRGYQCTCVRLCKYTTRAAYALVLQGSYIVASYSDTHQHHKLQACLGPPIAAMLPPKLKQSLAAQQCAQRSHAAYKPA